MTAKDMQYDVRAKLNKLDSQKYRNLRVQEVDWKLNEAQLILINQMYKASNLKEINEVVVSNYDLGSYVDEGENVFSFQMPENYLHYISGHAYIKKHNCDFKRANLFQKQFYDVHVDSQFDSSSYEWREVMYSLSNNRLLAYTDGTFEIGNVHINYVRIPKRIVSLDEYNMPNGELVTYTDCELHVNLHNMLVDIAVMIIAGDLQMQDVTMKINKIKLN